MFTFFEAPRPGNTNDLDPDQPKALLVTQACAAGLAAFAEGKLEDATSAFRFAVMTVDTLDSPALRRQFAKLLTTCAETLQVIDLPRIERAASTR
jgi:hypothetical protein